jgi:hypothetical protein
VTYHGIDRESLARVWSDQGLESCAAELVTNPWFPNAEEWARVIKDEMTRREVKKWMAIQEVVGTIDEVAGW